jgi:transposase
MILSISASQRYFVFNGFADMRKGFNGLCGLVRNELGKNPTTSDVFIFFNKPRTHVKILAWEGDGYAVYYKRLERGTFEIPPCNQEFEISAQTLSLILQGIVLSSVKMKKRYLHRA